MNGQATESNVLKFANDMILVFVKDYAGAVKRNDKDEIAKHRAYLKLPASSRGLWWEIICDVLGLTSESAARKLIHFLDQVDHEEFKYRKRLSKVQDR